MSDFIDIDESDDPDYVPQMDELSENSDSEPDVDISRTQFKHSECKLKWSKLH